MYSIQDDPTNHSPLNGRRRRRSRIMKNISPKKHCLAVDVAIAKRVMVFESVSALRFGRHYVPLFVLVKYKSAHSYPEAFKLFLGDRRSKGNSPDVGSTATSAGMALADGVNSFAMGFVPSTERRLSMNTRSEGRKGWKLL